MLRVVPLLLALAGAPAPASTAQALPPAFRDAPAVVLDERITATLKEERRTLRTERKVLLLDRRGFDQADQSILYDSERSILRNFAARTRKADGEIVEIPAELRRDSVLFRNEKREWHILQFTFPAIEPGSTLEWEYELGEKTADRLDWWETQRDIPVLRASYTVQYLLPESPTHGVKFFSRVPWTPWCRPSDAPNAKMMVHEMVCERVPAFEREEFSPPEGDTRLRLLVGLDVAPNLKRPLSDRLWISEGRWWKQKIDAFLLQRAAVQDRARKIVYGATTLRERIDRVMRWTQENIHVRDDPFTRGLEGLAGQARSADEVLERGGGAAEEVTLLTMALLQEAGVSARAILTNDQSRQRADFAIPDAAQVDHVMLQVAWDQGASGFIDPTCRYCQPGIPDWRFCTGDSSVLLVGDFALPVLLGTIPLVPGGSIERWKQTVEVHPDGSAEVDGLVAWTGHDDVALREHWEGMTIEGRREEFTQRLGGSVEPLSIEPSAPADRAVFLHVKYRYRRSDAAVAVASSLLLRPIDVFTSELDLPLQEERRQPVRRDYARTIAAETVFHLPDGFAPPSLPRGDSVHGPGFRFESEWSEGTSDREIVWRGRLLKDSAPIPAADYGQALAFDRDLRNLLRSPLVLDATGEPAETEAE